MYSAVYCHNLFHFVDISKKTRFAIVVAFSSSESHADLAALLSYRFHASICPTELASTAPPPLPFLPLHPLTVPSSAICLPIYVTTLLRGKEVASHS